MLIYVSKYCPSAVDLFHLKSTIYIKRVKRSLYGIYIPDTHWKQLYFQDKNPPASRWPECSHVHLTSLNINYHLEMG